MTHCILRNRGGVEYAQEVMQPVLLCVWFLDSAYNVNNKIEQLRRCANRLLSQEPPQARRESRAPS